MNTVTWILIVLGILIAGFIALLVIYSMTNSKNKPNNAAYATNSLDLYKNPNTWGQATPTANADRNSCKLYTFPGLMVGTTAFPGEPTLLSSVVDNLTPAPPTTCIDSDQIEAAQLNHTCQGLTGHPSFCFLQTGQQVIVGATETFYDSSNCDVPQCQGELALIALKYNPPSSYQCVYGVTGTGFLNTTRCDITDQKQLFRITRMNPGGSVPPPGQPNNGLLAQIVFRPTGQCVDAGSTTPSANSSVVLGNCGNDNGFVWALIPSLTYRSGNTGPVKTTPQQIVFVGGVTSIPQFNTSEDVVNFMTSNNLLSMSQDPVNVSLKPFATDGGQTSLQSAQYLTYGLYNVILNTKTPF